MGITSSLFKQESCHGQSQYGSDQERADISDETMDVTAFYVRTLAVPARRKVTDARVVAGARLFEQSGCTGCHVRSLKTGAAEISELSNQTIFPYTDMLLHDMGDDLGDGRPDYLASGNEWRTPPLWGIGLTQVVSGHTYFLHDGRARNLLEAIMWHGGEAERSREFVRGLNRSDRETLLAFLWSL
jgi:CxxC motif-containing protein (DUF1111 family)